MFLTTDNTPASAPGGHVWDHPGHIVEVADELGHELLHIAGAAFREILPGDPNHPKAAEIAAAEKAAKAEAAKLAAEAADAAKAEAEKLAAEAADAAKAVAEKAAAAVETEAAKVAAAKPGPSK